jgi:hypothetical protein
MMAEPRAHAGKEPVAYTDCWQVAYTCAGRNSGARRYDRYLDQSGGLSGAGLGGVLTVADFVIQNLSAKRNLVGNVGAPLGPYSITAGGGAFNLGSLFQSDAITSERRTPGAFVPTVLSPWRDAPSKRGGSSINTPVYTRRVAHPWKGRLLSSVFVSNPGATGIPSFGD